MEDKRKMNRILTGVIIAAAVIIAMLVGYWIFDTAQTNIAKKEAEAAADNWISGATTTQGGVSVLPSNTTQTPTNTSESENVIDVNIDLNSTSITTGNTTGSSTSGKTVQTFAGFTMIGTIEIPKINLKYPVLDRADKASMEAAPGKLYGVGLNKVGNTVIAAHNYRNRTFFSKLDQLSEGDSIFITDTDKNRVEYIIYNIYTTGSEDNSYWQRDTQGAMEISLSTCTDDVQQRLIVWAIEKDKLSLVKQ